MTKKQKIKQHLEQGKSITPLQAVNLYGCLALSQRIGDLRNEGMTIDSKMITTPTARYKRYWKV